MQTVHGPPFFVVDRASIATRCNRRIDGLPCVSEVRDSIHSGFLFWNVLDPESWDQLLPSVRFFDSAAF